MEIKLNRNLDNNFPLKAHKNIHKSEKADPVCFAVFSMLFSASKGYLSGLSVSNWSTCITVLC